MFNVDSLAKQGVAQVKAAVEKAIVSFFGKVHAGGYIAKNYAQYTIARREKYGLPADSVRLYGSDKYSRKNNRMLDRNSWTIYTTTNRIYARHNTSKNQLIWVVQRGRYKPQLNQTFILG